MKRKIMLIMLFASTAGLTVVRGQSIAPATINATGGSGIIAGNIYDWSVGEMTMVSTFTGTGIVVTQGVLQPTIFPAGVKETTLGNKLEVFPNPASTIVNLLYTATTNGMLNYRLMDMAGRVVINKSTEINQGTTTEQLNVAEFAAATYMLEVSFTGFTGAKESRSYKIDKLK